MPMNHPFAKICSLMSIFLVACGSGSAVSPDHAQTLAANSSIKVEGKLTAQSLEKWNNYVARVNRANLQPECLARYFPSKNAITKGSVVLFHGFSACPQQFWEIADHLSRQGYEVLLPLFPGHGQERVADKEDLTGVPKSFEWSKYVELVLEMAEIVRSSPGEKAIGGLSVGAALATYAMLDKETRGVWQRALIMAPVFNSLDDWRRVFPEVVGNVPVVGRMIERSWGPQCEIDRSHPFGPGDYKRGGFCSFKADHSAAVEWLGQHAIQLLQDYGKGKFALPASTKIQLIYADFDEKTRKKSLDLAVQQLSKHPVSLAACSFGSGVPHSFISRYDAELHTDPERKKPWLNDLILHATEFLVSGRSFPTISNAASAYPGVSPCAFDSQATASPTWYVPPRD